MQSNGSSRAHAGARQRARWVAASRPARRCTWWPTGPATSPTAPRSFRSSSRPAPTPTTETPSRVPRRRCTGRPAATTSTSRPRSSTAAPTSKLPDGSIGTPLDNAIGYGCWHVARLLVARGARVDKLWHAGALGLLDRLEELLDTASPTTEEVSQGFWHACAGGQRRAAERLLAAGADLNWEPGYAHGTPLDAAGGLGTRQENVIGWLKEKGALSAEAGTT